MRSRGSNLPRSVCLVRAFSPPPRLFSSDAAALTHAFGSLRSDLSVREVEHPGDSTPRPFDPPAPPPVRH